MRPSVVYCRACLYVLSGMCDDGISPMGDDEMPIVLYSGAFIG